MGIRTGRQLAPLAAVLLITVAGCAQPAAGPLGVPSTGAPLTSASAAGTAAARSSEHPSATPAAPSPPPGPATPSAAAAMTSGAGQAVSPLPSCSPAGLATTVRGTLTFAVNSGAGAPWFIGNPSDGQGFEAAVGAAVARQLGFGANRVQWKTASLPAIQAAQVAGADVGIGEIRTPDQGSDSVDYSTGYFSVSDSVVARAGTPAAKATGLPALAKLRVAALARSTDGGANGFQPASSTSYPSTAAALAALRRGAVDVAVVPTPVAVTAGSDITVVGQLSLPTEQPAQFGMVLARRSPLTSCVSAAIDQLRVSGALTALVQRWVPAANKPLS